MTDNGMSRAERDDLLARHRETEARLYGWSGNPEPSDEEAARLSAILDGLIEEYEARLPRVQLSRCPHCDEVLTRAFDPYGLDGFWWNPLNLVEPPEPPVCEHFCVLLGAVHMMGRPPGPWEAAVQPGPEVPYVVPRLLGLPGMRAVISSVQLATGERGFPIAYFADPKPDSADLHQPWAKESYQVVSASGKPKGFAAKNDVWDFELTPWIETGAVRWIEPGDGALTLRGRGDGICPYVDMEGARQPQEIGSGERFLLDVPDGTPVDLSDD